MLLLYYYSTIFLVPESLVPEKKSSRIKLAFTMYLQKKNDIIVFDN